MSDTVKVLQGGAAVDDRGKLQFCNDFNLDAVQRFYVVSNHRQNFIRAWHGHKRESKFAYVVTGAALFGVVKVDDWGNPDKDLTVDRQVLCEQNSDVLFIPSGHAHGFKTLTKDTKVIFFSTAEVSESLKDDFRFEFDYWNPWEISQR